MNNTHLLQGCDDGDPEVQKKQINPKVLYRKK